MLWVTCGQVEWYSVGAYETEIDVKSGLFFFSFISDQQEALQVGVDIGW